MMPMPRVMCGVAVRMPDGIIPAGQVFIVNDKMAERFKSMGILKANLDDEGQEKPKHRARPPRKSKTDG